MLVFSIFTKKENVELDFFYVFQPKQHIAQIECGMRIQLSSIKPTLKTYAKMQHNIVFTVLFWKKHVFIKRCYLC